MAKIEWQSREEIKNTILEKLSQGIGWLILLSFIFLGYRYFYGPTGGSLEESVWVETRDQTILNTCGNNDRCLEELELIVKTCIREAKKEYSPKNKVFWSKYKACVEPRIDLNDYIELHPSLKSTESDTSERN